MNCDCIEKLPNRILEGKIKFKERTILKVEFISRSFAMKGNQLDSVTFSDLKLEVEGYKKPQRQQIMHSFCPFCGTKIDKTSPENKSSEPDQQVPC